MKAELKVSFHNTCTIRKYRASDHKLLQKVKVENLVTNNMYTSALNPTWGSGNYLPYLYLVIGSGTGTPAITDTALFAKLWHVSTYNVTAIEYALPTSHFRYKYSIPANTSYVGTIREVGLSYDGTNLTTHALLKDAEGNPITIQKTEFDIIEFTYDFYVTIQAQGTNFKLVNPAYMGFLRVLSGAMSSCPGGWFLHGFCYYCYTSGNAWGTNIVVSLSKADDKTNFPNYYLNSRSFLVREAYPCGYVIAKEHTGNTSYPVAMPFTVDYATRKASITFGRMASEVGNTHFYQAITLPGFCTIPLPNEAILPAQKISNMSVGVGDGIKTHFVHPISYFKKDTDVLKVDGVTKVRGVDYVIDNNNNKDKLHELSPVANAIFSGGASGPYAENKYQLLRPNIASYISYNVYGPMGPAEGYPMYIDLQEAKTLNYFRALGMVYGLSSTVANNIPSDNPVTIYFEYSDDNVTWNLAHSFNYTTGATEQFWEPITARYWRMRIDTHAFKNWYGSMITLTQIKGTSGVTENPATQAMLGYVNPDIVFTEAPAVGAVITLDADMDVLFKNPNFVIDISLEISM